MDVTETQTALVALVEANPTLVLVDEKKFEDFYEQVKAEAKAMPVDLTTEKGRKAVASMAFKIARTKTAIDDAGKKLNEEARAKINAVDESRRKIRDRFDALKDEVRKPLTDWEADEAERIAKVDRFFSRMEGFSKVTLDDTAEDVKHRYESLDLVAIDERVFQNRHADAVAAKERALSALKDALDRVAREEQERAELARLRAEKEERDRQEAERKAAEERAEIERQEAEAARIAEEQRKEREAAEAKRQEEERARIAQEAAEKAKREAEEEIAALKRRAEEEEQARHNAEVMRRQAEEKAERERIEAEQRAEEEAKRREHLAAEAERQRAAQETAERERVEREQREADAARQADREHRAKIMGAAKSAIIEIGIAEDKAKEIVLAIAAGNVPHVSIKF